jgi:1,2-diacylglycerol 3-beta-glucosyltransferase
MLDFTRHPTGNRQFRARLVLAIWWGFIALWHLVPILAWTLTGLIAWYILRLWKQPPPNIPSEPITAFPLISILVPCRNEAVVVRDLVANLYQIDYPHLELWIADDQSTDGTGEVLRSLQAEYPQLFVYQRPPGATPGKSAVLNELFSRCHGDLILVFDADAQVEPNFLIQTLPYFHEERTGALQVRRVVVNATANWLTRCQQTEMLLDSYYQQQRVMIGGTGELRGNGLMLRRSALVACGGWNEETITDDLDLTFRLHLADWEIAFVGECPVYEEGVTSLPALWRQRQRWAEGGFQRYLDYGELLVNRLGSAKALDQGAFFIIQYLLPLGLFPDLALAWGLGHGPVLGFLTPLATVLGFWGMVQGQNQFAPKDRLTVLKNALWGTIYFAHWLPVMIFTLLRMALFPKRLNWVKTARQARNQPG